MREVKKLTKSLIAVGIIRTAYFFLIKRQWGDSNYPIQLSNLKDILIMLLIAYGVSGIIAKSSIKYRRIYYFFKLYAFSFSIIMLYPFLPNRYCDQEYIGSKLSLFNYCWLAMFCILLIYYYLYPKEEEV